MEAILVAAASFLIDACGPGASGPRPCEDGFLEHVVIENQQDIANLARANHVRRLEIIDSELETLEGLECIEWVETLRIEDNPRLTRLTGLEGLVEVKAEPCDEPWATAGCMEFPSTDAPYELPPGVGNASIVGNPQLQTLEGLGSLTVIHTTLEVRDNASLVSLEGLQSLVYVTLPGSMVWNSNRSAFRIEGNPQLKSLAALESYMGGSRLEVRGNPNLTELFRPRLSYPEYSGGFGFLVLEDLPFLGTLEGLTDWGTRGIVIRRVPLIEEMPRFYAEPGPTGDDPDSRYMYQLVLDENPGLRSIAGLPPIGTVQGQLVIRDNDALEVLTGLEHLEHVSGRSFDDIGGSDYANYAVLIEGNAILRNLDALDPTIDGSFLGHLNGNVSAIRYNPELPTCAITRLLGEDASAWIIEYNAEQACP